MIIHRRDAETLRKSKSQHQNHESAEVADGAQAQKAPGAQRPGGFGYFAGCESALPSHDR